jgi:hypothetical protein
VDPKTAALLKGVPASRVETYLRSREWQSTEVPKVDARLWSKTIHRHRYEFLFPSSNAPTDYHRRFNEALGIISGAEGLSKSELLTQISTAPSTLFKLALRTTNDNVESISLADGRALVTAAERMITAATITVAPPISQATWREARLRQYLRSVQLAQTERGSYVVVIALPTEPDEPGGEGFGREVAHELDARIRVVGNRLRWQLSGEEADYWNYVDKLYCRALAPLADSHELESLRVSLREPEGVAEELAVDLGPVELSNAREVALEFERLDAVGVAPALPALEPPEEVIHENVIVLGRVTRLARPDVSIRGEVLGRMRTVRARLSPEDYRTAIEAHAADRTVQIIGDVAERHGSLRFTAVFSLSLV